MIPPVRFPDGRIAKYLVPTGLACRAYFPPLPVVWDALATPGAKLAITEGILKALAASQEGLPCIGLMGVWNWVVAGSKPRQLIPDLAEIDLQGRPVLVFFDTDVERRPNVHYAAAEFARVLTEAGASVRLPRLPLGPPDADGRPTKQALDDFAISSGGHGRFRKNLSALIEEPKITDLTQLRAAIEANRRKIADKPGLHLDTSPTGSGKSTADFVDLRRSERRSLIVVPAHVNCGHVVQESKCRHVECVAFPKLSEENCRRFEEAQKVIGHGLKLSKTLCYSCEFKDGCTYWSNYNAAMEAQNIIATHRRAEISMKDLTSNRNYISIHESPMATFRPMYEAKTGFLPVAQLAHEAGVWLRYGQRGDRPFYSAMERIATELHTRVNSEVETTVIALPEPAQSLPKNADRLLWEMMRVYGIRPPGNALALVKTLAEGDIDALLVKVDEKWQTTRQGITDGGENNNTTPPEIELIRSIVGYGKMELPIDAVVCINDATGNRQQLESVTGRPVRDITPPGKLPRKQPVVQIRCDVTRKTEVNKAAEILRGILYDLPYQRAGVLTHQGLVAKLPKLIGEDFGCRVSMWEYFFGGQSRGSNDWLDACDVLIVLGTPRVPPGAIRSHLLRIGNLRAAQLSESEAGWQADWWSGVTE
jgi:hypothetical protein